MQVYVTELWRRPQVVEDISIPASLGINLSSKTFLYIPIPRWTSVDQLDDAVYRIPSTIRRSSNYLVLRAHKTEAEAIRNNNRLAQRLSLRLEGLPILLLCCPDGDYAIDPLEPNKQGAFTESPSKELVQALRYAEMKALTQRSGAFLPPSPSFHYEAPNGYHYKSFLRVGHAFQSVDTLDSAAFWLVPHLAPDTLLITDSSTILSIALNAKRYLIETGHLKPEQSGLVECLRSYDESQEDVIRRLISIRQSSELLSRAVVLISVSSSGGLVKRLLSACMAAGYNDPKIVALYSSPTSQAHLPGETFCELDDEFHRYEKRDCELCKGGSSVVPIEPNTYRLEVSAAVRKVRIKASDSNANEFLERYRGLNPISVHRDQHDATRHHMLHVDIAPLLEAEAFLKRLEGITADLEGTVDIVLGPRHAMAFELSSRVANLLRIPTLSLDESELLSLDHATRPLLLKKRILLVDDVVITGTRLRGYKNYLLRAGLLDQESVVACLVGVERPSDSKTKQAIIDMVHGPENFHGVESVLLPNWQTEECPWCWELDQLTSYGDLIRNSKPLSERYALLKNSQLGLKSQIFLYWASTEERDKQLRLGPRSIFGSDLNDVEVFASVASAIQTLRDKGALNEQYTQPVGRVLEPEFYLKGRYYDPILTASILRAARRCDIRSTMTDSNLLTCLTERLKNPAATELRSELLFAAAQGKLPMPSLLNGLPNGVIAAESGVRALLKAILSIKD